MFRRKGSRVQDHEVVLGQRYRDVISGWEGVATARYEYLNGCTRIELSAQDKDGAPKGYVFDVEQIAPVEAVAPEVSPATKTGGPRDSTPVDR